MTAPLTPPSPGWRPGGSRTSGPAGLARSRALGRLVAGGAVATSVALGVALAHAIPGTTTGSTAATGTTGSPGATGATGATGTTGTTGTARAAGADDGGAGSDDGGTRASGGSLPAATPGATPAAAPAAVPATAPAAVPAPSHSTRTPTVVSGGSAP